ncbi:MAG: hypothetical protein A2Y15_09180 [Clostridiales bacterium GWF2_36_10]|nr:MAG: hypothetical protein A2Y15_09180 [Clostridiales bacterium GWF2_36_10]HAN21448.1 HAD family hydrolase [Clostridiales bacterium]
MSKKYDTLLFDLDGTLLDTLGDLTDGVNYVLSRFSFNIKTQEEICSYIGNGIPTLLRRAMPEDCSDEQHSMAIHLFGEYYKNNMKNLTKPYKGITELLRKLKDSDYKIGVVSNKNDSEVKELCAYFFRDIFDIKFAFGATTEETRKPSPRLIFDAVELFESDKSHTLFIGDSEVDIQTAKNAEIDIICVGWGFRDSDFLHINGAKIVAKDADDLWILLTSLA